MDKTTGAVLIVNDQFYRALSLADFGAMERVWLTSPDAVCVHPGWLPLYGWPAIGESWRSIFVNQGPLHIWPSETVVRLYGQTAEVICLENIDMGQVAGTGILQTRATNVFRLIAPAHPSAQAWKMLEHHAIPMAPGQVQKPDPFSAN